MVLREQLLELLRSGHLDLIPTQDKICFPIVERIFKKMSINLTFSSIRVDKDLIIDGHHRYLASLLAAYEKLDRVPGLRTSAKTTTEWKFVTVVDDDWDMPAKIEQLNKQDADYNSMTVDELIKKLG